MKHHLKICANFLNDSNNVFNDIVVKIKNVQMQKKLENKNNNEENNSFVKRQQTFEFSIIKKITKKFFDTLIARTIFENDKSLSIFENSIMLRFLKILNSIYTSFFKKIIFDVLLNEIFEKKKQKIEKILHDNDHINFTIDDVFNINQKRIVNLIVQTFQYDNFHFAIENMSIFEHIVEQLTFRIFQKMLF